MDGDGTGLPLHLLALPGQVAELLAVHLQGRVHGRHLEDLSPEGFQDFLQLFRSEVHGTLLQGLPPDILRVGGQT